METACPHPACQHKDLDNVFESLPKDDKDYELLMVHRRKRPLDIETFQPAVRRLFELNKTAKSMLLERVRNSNWTRRHWIFYLLCKFNEHYDTISCSDKALLITYTGFHLASLHLWATNMVNNASQVDKLIDMPKNNWFFEFMDNHLEEVKSKRLNPDTWFADAFSTTSKVFASSAEYR